MKIPPILEEKIQLDHALTAFVNSILNRVDSHITSNPMIFFPEYTDHGIRHLELTMQSAADFATSAARQLITPVNAATLVVAIALHDIGMYLSRDGFESLIQRDSSWKGVSYFGDQDWRSLWEDFYAEATRFDGRKLRSLFGDNYRPVRPLPEVGASWEDFDYLLAGEFLRRHHPRLAHDIALYGLPGKDKQPIPICLLVSSDERFWADISGMVARSHGMDLRKCLGYLDAEYQNRINPKDVYVAFLAVLVRIADYFQIQARRAPTERTEVRTFQSLLSEREWSVHQAVEDIHNTGSDPEAIMIHAKPKDVQTYLRLKAWLDGLQGELDRSWAILGEVYGLQDHNQLNLLGLRIRRVRSNLDNVASFAKSVTYIPDKIAFESANADLLKLLVGPLYSNDPGIGLRELFQNAIDAVRELEDLISRHAELSSIDQYQQDADVCLHVLCDKDDLPLEITLIDRGVGMTANTVRDYFLKAGASFRQSIVWREEHEDSAGRSRVFRTGRFGVGVLAAFLLGDEIEVTTRHARSEKVDGVTFKARLDDEEISINRIVCPVGTKIHITVPEQKRRKVAEIVPPKYMSDLWFSSKAGHYFLQKPSLGRHFSSRKDLIVKEFLPQSSDKSSEVWRCLSNVEFDKIFWTYRPNWPVLSGNGIVIIPPYVERQDYPSSLLRHLNMPHLSVFDKNGYLPVNLQRTGLQGPLPFLKDLIRSVADDLIAFALVEAPRHYDSRWVTGTYEGFKRGYNSPPLWSRWLVGKSGLLLNDDALVRQASPKLLILIIGNAIGEDMLPEAIRRHLPPDTLLGIYHPHTLADTSPRIKGTFRDAVHGKIQPSGFKKVSYETFVPQTLLSKIRQLKPGREITGLLSRLAKSETVGNWIVHSSAQSDRSFLRDLLKNLDGNADNPLILCAMELEMEKSGPLETTLADRWLEVLGSPIIPFGRGRRNRLEEVASPQIKELLQIRRTSARAKKKHSVAIDEAPSPDDRE